MKTPSLWVIFMTAHIVAILAVVAWLGWFAFFLITLIELPLVPLSFIVYDSFKEDKIRGK